VGDQIATGDASRIALNLIDGSQLRLEANTTINIKQLVYEGKFISEASFVLEKGKAWSYVKPLKGKAKYEVETPTITAAVRGTAFNVGYIDGTSRVYVSKHSVGVKAKTGDGSQVVDEKELLQVKDGGQVNAPENIQTIPKDQIDDWIIFNEGLDRDADAGRGPKLEGQSESSDKNPIEQVLQGLNPTSGNQNPPATQPATKPEPTPTPVAKQLVRIAVSSQASQVQARSTGQFVAKAYYSDNTVVDVSSDVTWAQTESLLDISANGSFTALRPGQTVITASFGGMVSNRLPVTVEVISGQAY
jgi:hypothetical protein